MDRYLLWLFAFAFVSWLFLTSVPFLSFYIENSSCVSTFGTAHD